MFPQRLSGYELKRFTIWICLVAALSAHGAQSGSIGTYSRLGASVGNSEVSFKLPKINEQTFLSLFNETLNRYMLATASSNCELCKKSWGKFGHGSVNLNLNRLPGELINCTVLTNDGKEIKLFPATYSSELDKELIIRLDRSYQKVVYISVPYGTNLTAKWNGKWSVERFYSDENNKETKKLIDDFDVRIRDIYRDSDIIPGNKIKVLTGDYAIFEIAKQFPNLESCILEDGYERQYDLFGNYSHWRIQEPGICGARIKIYQNSSTSWTLYADNLFNETYYANIEITAFEKTKFDSKQETSYLLLGDRTSVEFSDKSMKHCQLENPNGMKMPVQKSCSYEIPFVKKSHEGLWKVYYGVEGSNTEFEAQITVVTLDPLSTTVDYERDSHINLLCQVRADYQKLPNTYSYFPSEYGCQFTRPDTHTMTINPGIGSGRYEYYGRGYRKDPDHTNHDLFDCGLTIRSPAIEDFGAWKCSVFRHRDEKTFGTVLRTEHLIEMFGDEYFVPNMNPIAHGSKVYASKGNSFTLKCSAEAALNYCWMMSPNGTVYTLSKEKHSVHELTYNGTGLEFGECGAIVEVADNTHMGDWSCHMGVVNGMEVAAQVSVTVTDSILMADEETIEFSVKKPTTLKYRIIPGCEDVINYCRWIRPDGQGISHRADNRYRTRQTISSCELTIAVLHTEVDIGLWKCAAGIAGPEMREETIQIRIEYPHRIVEPDIEEITTQTQIKEEISQTQSRDPKASFFQRYRLFIAVATGITISISIVLLIVFFVNIKHKDVLPE